MFIILGLKRFSKTKVSCQTEDIMRKLIIEIKSKGGYMNKRIDSLNFIRILGMTMILLFHARLLYGFSTGITWLDEKISIGAIFVTVFFMLSGFGLRISNADLSVRDFSGVFVFYKKRIFSIYPLFLLLTIVALLFHFRVMDSFTETLAHLPIQFSMLHILFGKAWHNFLFNDNCWYVSALFVLYLLFPFLNAFLKRFSVRGKIILSVVLWLLSSLIYAYLVYGTELVFLDYYPTPFLRIPEFMIGMILADLSEAIGEKVTKSHGKYACALILLGVTVIAFIVLTVLFPYFKQETNLYGLVVIPCTAVVFLCMANWEWLNRMGRKKIVRWLAGLGLEVYLCQSFATLVLSLVKIDSSVDELVFIGLTVVFAVVVNTVFRKRVKRMARG